MSTIETDYLVIGAGAAGMSFTDSLIDVDRDCDVVMVDRRHAPGGHWNDAYPFVRLHQPAACYGVNSRALGNDQLDERGLNAGLYQQADGVQICDYFRRVMDEHHVASGQVRFFPMSNYLGLDGSDVAFVATLTGATTEVKVRRAVVDARYLEPTIPSRHTPSFAIDPDVRCFPVNELPDRRRANDWLHGHRWGPRPAPMRAPGCSKAVSTPTTSEWIRTRDAWMWNKYAHVQPLELRHRHGRRFLAPVEASAEAESVDDLFARLEACGQLLRLDPNLAPTMYHAATLTVAELTLLRTIENVVRLGHIKKIDSQTEDRGSREERSRPIAGSCMSTAPRAEASARPPLSRSSNQAALPSNASARPTQRSTPRSSATSRPAEETTRSSSPASHPRPPIRSERRTGYRTCVAS